MMNLMNCTTSMNLSYILAEDSGAMELHSPKTSGMRRQSRLKKLFRK